MQPKKKPPQHIYSAFYSLHWGLWPLLFIIIQGNSEVFQSFNVSSMIVQEILLWKCLFQIINDKSCVRMVSSWPLRTSGSLVTYHRGPLPSSSCGKWRTFLPSSLQGYFPRELCLHLLRMVDYIVAAASMKWPLCTCFIIITKNRCH